MIAFGIFVFILFSHVQLKDEDVEIVKMDASNNDVPSPFDVRGFPTLYWVPKGSKSSPVRYEVRVFSPVSVDQFKVSTYLTLCFFRADEMWKIS